MLPFRYCSKYEVFLCFCREEFLLVDDCFENKPLPDYYWLPMLLFQLPEDKYCKLIWLLQFRCSRPEHYLWTMHLYIRNWPVTLLPTNPGLVGMVELQKITGSRRTKYLEVLLSLQELRIFENFRKTQSFNEAPKLSKLQKSSFATYW